MKSLEILLKTVGLKKKYGGVDAIAGVDFELREGELRCLIGANGAGKSTFFKMLTGQISPSEGIIKFQTNDITYANSFEISRLGIGIKNQVPDVYDGITVEENIWLAAQFRHNQKEIGKVVSDVTNRLGLNALSNTIVGELSHGQRQWVEFGMVIALQPKLILLDEPTAGMSLEETKKTAELILEINKDASIIVVEHDMQFIQQIAKMVTVFHQGTILAEDTMENIKKNEAVRDVYLGRSVNA